jgi:cytochrome oxidase Cu insertion factor (SCO1/SenC/PrrC family)
MYHRANIRMRGAMDPDSPLRYGRNDKTRGALQLRGILAVLTVLLGLGSLVKPALAQPPERSAAELMDAMMWNREPIGGEFALIDQNGARRTDTDFRGKLMLVYFGFTYCPDICPSDLQQMALAVDRLGADGEIVQPIFITLDPERDTAEHLKDYMALFHPRFVGLTGDAAAVKETARAYRVYFQKVERENKSDYTIDHSAFLYLMGRDGEYLGFFPPGTSAERLVDAIRPHLAAQR